MHLSHASMFMETSDCTYNLLQVFSLFMSLIQRETERQNKTSPLRRETVEPHRTKHSTFPELLARGRQLESQQKNGVQGACFNVRVNM